MNSSFLEIFNKHLSDKGINGYAPVYDEYFSAKRYDNIKLLEIGIGTLNPTHSNMLFWKDKYHEYKPGASLRAFKEYFPNGLIYGVDIQSDCMVIEDRIQTYLFNSTEKIMVENYFRNIMFDFIVDDGDHNFNSQIKTFENLFVKLNEGGVYILEDLESPEELRKYFATTNHNYLFRNELIVIKK